MTLAAAHLLYCLAAIATASVLWLSPRFDLRGVGRIRRRPRAAARDEHDFDDTTVDAELAALREAVRRTDRLYTAPRADVIVLITLCGAVGLLSWAAAGFVVPRAVSTFFTPVDWAADDWIIGAPIVERLAQGVGAIAGAAIGLRLFQITLALGALAIVIVTLQVGGLYALGRIAPPTF